ncbi:MAG: aminotransferase class V-fold PLP-dependent enzyme, partial [Saprospiraceae bacterium]|nr:aminotransferase class V-fold PLP-dependent enzyme [Saprospiraceae bacterium]
MSTPASSRVTATTPLDVASIRADFPLLDRTMHGQPLAFLDNAASSQKPQQVIDAMRNYYQSQHANVHRGVYEISAAATDAFESVRRG